MVGSKWMKVKMALGLKVNSCIHVPTTPEDLPPLAVEPHAGRFNDAVSLSPRDSGSRLRMPTTPTPSSSGLRLPKHSPKSGKKICAICLATMKPGHGHAIFTAECSHSFHFQCITSNVRHGKQNCPVCRAKWKEIPFQGRVTDKYHEEVRVNDVHLPHDDTWMTALPLPRVDVTRNVSTFFQSTEPIHFDDDDQIINQQPDSNPNNSIVSNVNADDHSTNLVEVETFTEVSSVPKLTSHNDFSVLIHLKAPVATQLQHPKIDRTNFSSISQTRAPVDLVTVLDVSGSMAGSKLALLKRAMGFVIQNLGPSDRLSVIAFSSTARRLFPLRRMTDTGKNEAIQAINSLSSNGGTNIADGLSKGAKVITECKCKNPIGSIILLSDGQDTCTVNSPSSTNSRSDYHSLLPVSMHRDSASSVHIPIHAFGFGADHDAVSMHSISETSGGTFSFIEAESVIQDAFAQCIGGLLSVVVQDLKVEVECIDPVLQLNSVKSGSYKTTLAADKRKGLINVGDLYAEEERDFLVTVDIPINERQDEMSLLLVKCDYRHPITNNVVTLYPACNVRIQRPRETGQLVVSMEVDKQRNRLLSAEAIAEAKAAAEQGDLASAVAILENYRKQLSETVSAQAGDRLCALLDGELCEMQERMANRQIYERSGRAYVLSGLSSHSWQRATARGDSTNNTSLAQAYQTPSMVDMVNLSQTMVFGKPSPRPKIQPTQSFPAHHSRGESFAL